MQITIQMTHDDDDAIHTQHTVTGLTTYHSTLVMAAAMKAMEDVIWAARRRNNEEGRP